MPKTANGKAKIRCAIYTRKSSEEGLEQAFNSLDAQREACEAYILSQKHEGWTTLSQMYDDGGLSGATMERPALKRLLAAIETGDIDTVVVYKVDRLTRSLSDFSKIVDIFDARGVSFVAVTQQFNTTTSMGRLTLNMLLSFAQFEREVTGERIRDKIAASKKKGMWMGGNPPLGYDARDKKLVVNGFEAEVVRRIFDRYAALGSVRLLKQELDHDGIVSKVRRTRHGDAIGGKPFDRGALYRLLQNRIFLGETVHKDQSYPGEHQPIIDQALWDRVQDTLDSNRVERRIGANVAQPSLLAGLLHDDRGVRMTPSHAVKNGKRYRYYVSEPLIKAPRDEHPYGRRIPAGDIEHLIVHRLRTFLTDRAAILASIENEISDAVSQDALLQSAERLAEHLGEAAVQEVRSVMLALIDRIDVHAGKLDVHIRRHLMVGVLQPDGNAPHLAQNSANDDEILTLTVSARLKRAGMEKKMIVDGTHGPGGKHKRDAALIKLLVRAHALKEKLLSGDGASLTRLAETEGITRSYFTRLLRLGFLAPDITKAIFNGTQPPTLTANKLMSDTRLPLDWHEQRSTLGFA